MTDISVIIACRNGAATLGETIASLLAQDWDGDWEIVFADNGSTDGSAEIFLAHAAAREAVGRGPRPAMRLVDAGREAGKAGALNRALAAARGAAILFCDADDTVAPGWLAAMAEALARHPFVAARIDTAALNPPWVRGLRRLRQEAGLGRLSHEPFCLYAGGATLGLRREVLEAVGGFDPTMACLEDTDFCIRAALAGQTLVFVPEAVYNYRLRTTPEGIFRQSHTYARYRARLRRRYGAPEPRFVPGPWLGLLARLGTLLARRAGRAVLGPPLGPAEAARFHRNLGGLTGDLVGALAYGVAPRRRDATAGPTGGLDAGGLDAGGLGAGRLGAGGHG